MKSKTLAKEMSLGRGKIYTITVLYMDLVLVPAPVKMGN